MNINDKYKVLEKEPKFNTEYMNRQRAINLMAAGYAENNLDKKVDEVKRAQAMAKVELTDVEQRNPMMMMSSGYRVLDELKKEKVAETDTTIQFYDDEANAEADDYLARIAELDAKLDEYASLLNDTKK